jgi:hypothetical protein
MDDGRKKLELSKYSLRTPKNGIQHFLGQFPGAGVLLPQQIVLYTRALRLPREGCH